jgi:succinate-semialdehyde dehydrogenase/glutarate-semialdehyde dehydrogenase
MSITSINPTTGHKIKSYSALSIDELRDKISGAHTAFDTWKSRGLTTRIMHVQNLIEVLETSGDDIANLMVKEMGKTLSAAHAELDKCISFSRYCIDNAELHLDDTTINTEYKKAFTRRFPLGPILLIMPWNFPFWQVIRIAIPALLAGNTCLLKHASNVPGCALKLQDVFSRAGFPDGCFQSLLIGAKDVAHVIQDERIRGVSLTGSEAAGSAVAAQCGQHIKKCVLELGGSDPFIIMPSADIDAALEASFISRMRNNGQSCIAAKRLIIHADIYDDFRDRFFDKVEKICIGDPLDSDTDMGPLASQKALEDINAILEQAREQGAHIRPGQQILPTEGYFIPPGIIENVTKDMSLYTCELFAPLAILFKVNDIDEAIHLANDTPFGLSSVLFSQDEREQGMAIQGLHAGSTFINRYASSDIRLPFGGIKRSGYGREMGAEGFQEFTNLKTIIVAD